MAEEEAVGEDAGEDAGEDVGEEALKPDAEAGEEDEDVEDVASKPRRM